MTTAKRAPNEYRTAIENLKRSLKQHHITYKDLAEGIGLSESGVKKIFAAEDGSFQRLAQISKYMGIAMAELFQEAPSIGVDFSSKQQAEFLKDPTLFYVFWLLVYERQSLEDTKKQLKLSATEAFKKLRTLDLLGLIELLPDNRLRVPAIQAIHWTGDGEFYRKIYREWSQNLVATVAKPKPGPDELFIVRYLQMSTKTYTDFINAQKNLEEEFIRRSLHEMRSKPPGLCHVRMVVAADKRSFVTGQPL